MGRLTGGGLVACLWLWTSTGSLHARPGSDPAPATSYQSALDRFNHADYPRALRLLDAAPAGHNAHAQADIFNLRGAIFLREHRNDEARVAFAAAVRLDPDFLAARFNVVEVDFREKRYAESHRQFSALLAQTSRLGQTTERRFIEYKLMLADLLDGNEKPAADYIAAHRADAPPPLAWYYLNAALEYQRGHSANGAAWLQEVGTHYAASSEQVFANSFVDLGWSPHDRAPAADAPTSTVLASAGSASTHARTLPKGSVATAVAMDPLPERGRGLSAPTPARQKVRETTPVDALPTLVAKESPARAQNVPPSTLTTINVVSLIPVRGQSNAAAIPARDEANTAGPRPAVHFGFNPAPGTPAVEEMPPSEVGLVLSSDELNNPAHGASAAARVLAKPTSGHKPHAAASPADSPTDGETASSSPLPSPDAATGPAPKAATPSGTPSPAFVQKYEAATVQFLQKDYPGAIKLLDEADAIQPGQPNSITLRNQIFKQCYEAAYSAYQHADYPGALTQLDGADATHSNTQNQSDAYNLRGLVLSKQRNYEAAESMFHKAVQTDPGLWAAKFNYAEVPFNYRNFTVARARFEELFSQTDPVKQPVEAELTQFKVFLTLLLEGKEDAARTFMQHFNFSGATPARYFCQASLNFYAGDVEKAQGWIDSARKEYPARKSSSFLEAFYRVGWLTDPNTPASGTPAPALVAASPSVAPALPNPTPAVAAATPPPKPSATPTPVALAAASPVAASPGTAVPPPFRILVTPPPVTLATSSASPAPAAVAAAKVSPTATPAPVLMAKASATPSVPPTAAPIASPSATVVARGTPMATPSPAATVVAKASATAAPSPTAPALVKASPTVVPASPTPAVAKASPALPSPTASATAMAAASPKLAPSVPAVALATPSPTSSAPVASVSPESSPADAGETAAQSDTFGNLARLGIVGVLGLYFLYVVARIGWAATSRKSKRTPAADASSYQGRRATEADEVEVKR